MIKGIKLLIPFFLLFYSCKTFQSAVILSNADVSFSKDLSDVKFRDGLSLIIIKVKIKGNYYNFIFDTGAGATIVSNRVVRDLNLKKISEITTQDSQHSSKTLELYKLDSLAVGDVYFKNFGVLVSNFNNIPELGCLNVDGIIGINLIKLANWKINYDSLSVTILPKTKVIDLNNFQPISFDINKEGMPICDFVFDNIREFFLLDLGKNSEIISVSKKTDLKVGRINSLLFGYSSAGLFGVKLDTVKYFNYTFLKNKDIVFNNILISQSSTSKSLIGNGFLKRNFKSIFFDFNKKMLYVNKKTVEKNEIYFSYGFTPKVVNENVVIGAEFLNFSNEVSHLNIGDTIEEINGIKCNVNKYCQIINEIEETKNKSKSLNIEVLKNKKIYSYSLDLKSLSNYCFKK